MKNNNLPMKNTELYKEISRAKKSRVCAPGPSLERQNEYHRDIQSVRNHLRTSSTHQSLVGILHAVVLPQRHEYEMPHTCVRSESLQQ
jgi:hypothetical protein